MVPPHHPQPSRPFGLSPIRVGKKVTIEEVPEDHRPSGRPNGLHGSRTQPRGETHPAGDHHHAPPGNQPRQQGSHCAHSPGRGHDNNMKQPARDQKTEPKPRETEGVPQTHEQEFSAPAVGATPLNPGVFLHTSANPTMALGYTQSYSFLPNQANATQGSAVPNTTAAFPAAVGNPQQPAALAANLGANLPTNTTYIGAPSMTYGEMDFQHGAPNHPQGLHFQPPVPDTTYGPMTHVYVPRHDGAAPPTVAGGAVQVPLQPQVAVGTSPTVTVHHQAPMPTVQPHVAAQPGVYVGGNVMPGTYPVQPAQNPGMVPGVQGVPGSATAHLPPDVTGVGKTISEIQAYHQDIATANNALEPEDFQPASNDPAKMYYCRELDGNWTLRSRFSIDKMGDWRWYQTPEGIFYAVRLPN